MNKHFAAPAICGLAFGLASAVLLSAAATSVTVELKDGMGKSVGTAVLKEKGSGVEIKLNVKGLPPGEHAVHIHGVAKCEGPAFTTAGGHFNPDMKKHGSQNPAGPHAGDMPNFTVTAKGTSKAVVLDPNVNLGTDMHSVFSNGGTALMIHADKDDYKTDPTGNAGGRIACGIIAK
jgi:Cu-Zn family superoxide dismutase